MRSFLPWLLIVLVGCVPGCSLFNPRSEEVQLSATASNSSQSAVRPITRPTTKRQTAFGPAPITETPAAKNSTSSSIKLASFEETKAVESPAKSAEAKADQATTPPATATPKSTTPLPGTKGAVPPKADDPKGAKELPTKPSESPADKKPVTDKPSTTEIKPGEKGIAVPNPDNPDATAATVPATNADDESSGAQLVTLDQAVWECQNSFLLQSAAERMNQAHADYTTATLLPNPTVSAIASLQPFPGHPFTPTKQGGPPQYDLGFNYPLDWYLFGKRNAAMSTTASWTHVANSDYQDFVRQRIAATRGAFFDVLEARELRDLSRQDVANLKQVEQMTIKQIDLGGAGTVELDRVRLALLTSERDLQTRETTLKNAKSQLRTLMGRTEADPDFEVSGSLEISEPMSPPSKEELLATAQQIRPDIASAQQQVDWAMQQINLEERRAKPAFGGFFGLTYQQQKKAIGFPDAPSYGGGVVLSLPLFDRNQGNISKANSVYSQAYYNLQAKLSVLQSEVDQAVTSYRAAYQAVTSINVEQATAARNVRDKVAAAYAAGGRPLIEVLDTERSYRDTSRLLINGRASYWRNLYLLNSVAGLNVPTDQSASKPATP